MSAETSTTKRILTAPVRFVRALGQFFNPRLKAGRIPLGRLAIVVELVIALLFVGYTLNKKSIRLPFASDPYVVQIVFAEAKGLDRFDQPAAAIAGSNAGRVTHVSYEDGRSIATLTLEPSARGKIFADATAALRPGSAIQNLVVNIDPGSPEAGPLPDGAPIPQSQSTGYVAVDELTSVLDADTQAYVQILVSEASRGIRGVESELRDALAELGRIAETATPISRALYERRRLLTQLTGHLDVIFKTLKLRGDELGEAIDAGAATLGVSAARETELAEATRGLAPLVMEAERSLRETSALASLLVPALDQLVPAADALPDAASELRALIPIASGTFDQVESLVEHARYPLELLVDGTQGIAQRLRTQIPVVQDLTLRAQLLNQYKVGQQQFADLWSGAFSVNDNLGPYGQVAGLKVESPRPENFALSSSSGAVSGGEDSRMMTQLAGALENFCVVEGDLACLLRFSTPGLPADPVNQSLVVGSG